MPKTLSRAPAYQFYPDKWEAGTSHLSDAAYRIYHRMLNWAWLHSDTQYTLPKDPAALAFILKESCGRIANALLEIQCEYMPLLQDNGRCYVSKGLKKEAIKQASRSEKAQNSANARWGNKKQNTPKTCERNANASPKQCSPSPSPTPYNSEPPTPPKSSQKFKPPTLDEVAAYAAEKEWTAAEFNAEEFMDFYDSNGWKVGKNSMKDWKATARRAHRERWTINGKQQRAGRPTEVQL